MSEISITPGSARITCEGVVIGVHPNGWPIVRFDGADTSIACSVPTAAIIPNVRVDPAQEWAVRTGVAIAERHMHNALPTVRAELAKDIAENMQAVLNMQLTMERARAPT